MIKRARLIYNPTSGREEMRRQLPDVLRSLERAGFETSCHATEGSGDATAATVDAIERGFDAIFAAGGDGTLYEVINGVANKEHRPPIGVLPVGTTNDFARALKIPRSMPEACEIIAGHHTRSIDIGRMNDRYFINIAGGGSMTELTYEVPSKLKTMIGQLAYYVKGLEKLPRLRPIRIQLECEQMQLDEEVMMFLIANSNSVGGFEKLAPNADLSDGLFDVFVLKKTNLAEFIKLTSLAIRGEHVYDPHLVHFKTNYLRIQSDDAVQINLDGELGGMSPCEFENLPRHIEFYVPGD
jgi:diacylglycerol kinase (ATP)